MYEETVNCEYTYTYQNNDTHNASCRYCDNGYNGAPCTFSYTSNANGTHTRACNICDNRQTISCNLQYTNINNTHSQICIQCRYIKSGSAPCMFKSDNTCRFCGAMKDSAVINEQEQEETL